jgi:hypothetical protein
MLAARRRRLRLLSLSLLLVGCQSQGDTPERRAEAAEMVDEYLAQLSGGEPDYGWSLLHPASQAQWETYAQYAETVESADWSGFRFRVTDFSIAMMVSSARCAWSFPVVQTQCHRRFGRRTTRMAPGSDSRTGTAAMRCWRLGLIPGRPNIEVSVLAPANRYWCSCS